MLCQIIIMLKLYTIFRGIGYVQNILAGPVNNYTSFIMNSK